MKRILLITLSLVLALVGGSAACAEDGFYVIGAGGNLPRFPRPVRRLPMPREMTGP